jgi:hypothetical protein
MKKRTFILRDDTFRKNLVTFLDALDLEKPLQVTVEDFKPKRSLNQNALYWTWLGIVANETGPVVVTIGNDTVEEPRSTTGLSKAEFSDYLERVQVFAAQELGIMLPWPDEHWAA